MSWSESLTTTSGQTPTLALIAEQAKQTPKTLAVICRGQGLTYRELIGRADRLAWYLQSLEVGPNVIVGLCPERSVEALIGMLAVLKAGGAYLPLDPSHPPARLTTLLEDAQAAVVLTQERLAGQFSHQGLSVVCLDRDAAAWSEEQCGAVQVHGGADSLAYVIYTSGSTGRPKGVLITHRNLHHATQARIQYYQTAPTKILVLSSLAFDASVAGIFWALTTGGTVVLPDEGSQHDIDALATLIAIENITHLDIAPVLYRELLLGTDPGLLKSLQVVIVGGEELNRDIVDEHYRRLPHTVLYNEYGPTEATVWASVYRTIPSESEPRVPIGQPIANTSFHIFDEQKQPVLIGVAGELYIGGAGVAAGYLNQPEMTAERFVDDPFLPGARLYRTGDRVRCRTDGQFEFLGRLDRQVKLRGYRIELEEIEKVITGFPGVRQAVVMIREDVPGHQRLVMYVEHAEALDHYGNELRAYLERRLPFYMVPSMRVRMSAWPVLVSGKIDRGGLPSPELGVSGSGPMPLRSANVNPVDGTSSMRQGSSEPAPDEMNQQSLLALAPAARLEVITQYLLKSVSTLLMISPAQFSGLDSLSNFGFDSLMAIRLNNRVKESFGVRLPMSMLLHGPTVESLAANVADSLFHPISVGVQGEAGDPGPVVTDDRLSGMIRRFDGAPRPNKIPLSFAQQELWFLDQLEPNGCFFNLPLALRLSGDLNVAHLEASVSEIVRRHEALRTIFPVIDGEPQQITSPFRKVTFPLIDLRGCSEKTRQEVTQRIEQQETGIPFDLTNGPLMRGKLLRFTDQDHVLLLVFHHIGIDGWSMRVFLQELSAIYEALSLERPAVLPESPMQYADYSLWERQCAEDGKFLAHLAYWKMKLAGAPPVLELPTDHPRSSVQRHQGSLLVRVLPAAVAAALEQLSDRQKITRYTAMLTAFVCVLARYTGRTDIIVGGVMANRESREVESMIGLFVNTVALRADLSGDPTVSTMLERVRIVLAEAHDHQAAPFNQIVDLLQVRRDSDRKALIQVMFNWEPSLGLPCRAGGLSISSEEYQDQIDTLDLTLSVREDNGELRLIVAYNKRLFEPSTIDRLLDHLQILLGSMAALPQARLSELEMLSIEERELVVFHWNRTGAEYATERCLQDLIEEQVRKTPDSVAVACGGIELTYRQLMARADDLAWYLQSLGVGPNVIVGLCLERSVEALIGVLAVWRAGGAYLPLDPGHPMERLAFMLNDAKVAVVLTQEKIFSALPSLACPVVCLDRDKGAWQEKREELSSHGNQPGALAYVIYTSGSTGRPKGVLITHRNLHHSTQARIQYYQTAPTKILVLSSLAFDASVAGIFWALTTGSTVVLPDEGSQHDIDALAALIAIEQITHLDIVPVLYRELLLGADPGLLKSLQVVIAGGEDLNWDIVTEHYRRLPQAALYNEYGPTEATVWASVYKTIAQEPAPRIPIGRPIANTALYVLDEWRRPTPIGIPGELYIGGLGVAQGYLNQPDLTAERFVPNPFSTGGQVYRTGDLARRRADGLLEFLGRQDHQVKLRGYRIELGEIEEALLSFPAIRQVVVLLRDDKPGQSRLVAYLLGGEGSQRPEVGSLRAFIAERLPSYMAPSAFVWMEAFPLTVTGKIDRQAFPDPDEGSVLEQGLVDAPRSPVEQALVEIWRAVLGILEIGVRDNFFELGGHSLMATQVISRVRETFQVGLPLRLFFQQPTIAGLAEEVERQRHQGQGIHISPPIEPVPRDRDLPLSFSQQRMWFLYQLAPESAAYNMESTMRLQGPLERAALAYAINTIVERHEAFRTRFRMTTEGPVQVIDPPVASKWEELDLRPASSEDRLKQAARFLAQESDRPFDLFKGPPARFLLVQLDQEDYLFSITMHHIVGDEWSFGIIERELAALYNSHRRGQAPALEPAPIHYADFAVWQRRCLTDEALKDQLAYWREKLAGLQVCALPTDHPRSRTQRFRGSHRSLELTEPLLTRLSLLSAQQGCTLSMTFLAVFQILLSRYTGQEDIAVGSPIANRTRLDTEGLVGLFVNTLVMRTDLSGNPTFYDVLKRVRETAIGAYDHQDMPFERLVDEFRTEHNENYLPLIQVLFNVANAPFAPLSFDGLSWGPFDSDGGDAQFDLSLSIEPDIRTRAVLDFCTDLFDGATIERMMKQYGALLESAANHPGRRISDLLLFGEDELGQILGEWNRTEAEYPENACLHELIEAQVQRTPEAVAISMDGQLLTYRELNMKANRVAHYLRSLGVGPSTLVGVYLERSLEMVVGLLGILKSGGAYLPLDPTYPHDRLAFMAEDSGATLIITRVASLEILKGIGARFICLDKEWGRIEQELGSNPEALTSPQDLAYVIYTSGSTGKPKGVEIQHQALVNFLWSMRQAPGLMEQDVLLSVTPLSFDIAGLELYLPLIVGARVELASLAETMDRRKLRTVCEAAQPTIMQATPATWRMLIEAGWMGSDRLTALCGGEALPSDLAAALLDRSAVLWNMYGPTETTIWSTIEQIERADQEVTIGRPIANTEIYILDQFMQPVPVGVSGELYIGGHGLARGYRNRPELTTERFVPHPFSKDPHVRLYRTGDLARFRPDGRIVHLGRLDHQVKIRGFRVELGEIEAMLSSHPAVRQVVVTAREDQHGLKQLAAYVVCQDVSAPTPTELRALLRKALPEYMVPSYFVFLDAMPLTANHKVDVNALPAPAVSRASSDNIHVDPRDGLEVQLAALWQQVLGVHDPGIHDNFFDLGGHSFKAAQLFYLLEQVYGRQLPLATLFQAPTIAELASVLSREQWEPPWQSLVAIQPSGASTPIFMVPGVGGNVLIFAKLAKLLGSDQPFYGLQARGLDGKETPFTSVPEMARHSVKEIQRLRPHGPYVIAGACTGGLIAYEIAQQLTVQGETVTLAMMDTWHPSSYQKDWNIWPLELYLPVFIVRKIWENFRVLLRTPLKDWASFLQLKANRLESLLQGETTEEERGTEDIPETEWLIERVTQATFHAVARYAVHSYPGRLLNIVASNRRVTESDVDTRSVWADLADGASQTVEVAAKDSGLLFRSPHVEEVSRHLQAFLAVDAQDETARDRRTRDPAA